MRVWINLDITLSGITFWPISSQLGHIVFCFLYDFLFQTGGGPWLCVLPGVDAAVGSCSPARPAAGTCDVSETGCNLRPGGLAPTNCPDTSSPPSWSLYRPQMFPPPHAFLTRSLVKGNMNLSTLDAAGLPNFLGNFMISIGFWFEAFTDGSWGRKNASLMLEMMNWSVEWKEPRTYFQFMT